MTAVAVVTVPAEGWDTNVPVSRLWEPIVLLHHGSNVL